MATCAVEETKTLSRAWQSKKNGERNTCLAHSTKSPQRLSRSSGDHRHYAPFFSGQNAMRADTSRSSWQGTQALEPSFAGLSRRWNVNLARRRVVDDRCPVTSIISYQAIMIDTAAVCYSKSQFQQYLARNHNPTKTKIVLLIAVAITSVRSRRARLNRDSPSLLPLRSNRTAVYSLYRSCSEISPALIA